MKNILLAVTFVSGLPNPIMAQQVTIYQADLTALDKDGDGAVSQSEYKAFSDFAFDKIDRNSDGVLSADEVDDHVVGDAFRMLDEDGNGTVTAEEFSAQMNEDFSSADKDGDGVLD